MAEYLIQDSTLIGVANAIREKNGTTEQIAVPEMASKILSIKTGIDASDVAEELNTQDSLIEQITTTLETKIGEKYPHANEEVF